MKAIHRVLILTFFVFIQHSFCLSQEVEVIGDLKITNGSEGEGKVLMSDADGVSSWLSSEGLLIEMHKNLPGGLKRLINWGISPITIWESGVPYDEFIGLDLYDGENYQFEVIFYLDTLGIHPFSCLMAGHGGSTFAIWGCSGTAVNGADGILLGDGQQNTLDVQTDCPAPPNPNNIFQQIQNAGPGWSIASFNETQMIYDVLISPGILTLSSGNQAMYWTSSEVQGANEATHAMMINLSTGIISEELKTTSKRAVTVKQIMD